jgi:hypothetical protein
MLGATAPASALAAALSENAVHAAPLGLMDSIVVAGVGGGGAGAAAGVGATPAFPVQQLAHGALQTMRCTQIKLFAMLTAAVVLSGTAVAVVVPLVGSIVTTGSLVADDSKPDKPGRSDRTTPTRALNTLLHEMMAGMDQGQGWIATTPEERACAEAVSDMMFEAAQLYSAIHERFNDSVKIALTMDIPDARLLDKAKDVYLDGRDDVAFVSYWAGEDKQFGPMIREGDEWKLAAGRLPMNANASLQDLTAKCREHAGACREFTRAVRAGEFDSIETAREAIYAKLGEP